MAQVPQERRLAAGESIRASLRDGTPIEIRRLRPSDAPMLADAFRRLSFESRRLRFMTPKDRLSDAELRYLTEVDGHRHEALAASDARTGQAIGVARFVRLQDEPEAAEVAVTVTDEWQHRGVGTLLLEALTERARSEGIAEFSALVASDNSPMIELLRRAGGEIQPLASGAGVVEYRTSLREAGLARDLRDALRSAAEGRFGVPVHLREMLANLVRQARSARGEGRPDDRAGAPADGDPPAGEAGCAPVV